MVNWIGKCSLAAISQNVLHMCSAAKQKGLIHIEETPTLAEMIASFDPDRHGGEVLVTVPVGVEEG
ncbi:MAG: hypothetical protein WCK54_05895 [Desulfuromonadales bacterium]